MTAQKLKQADSFTRNNNPVLWLGMKHHRTHEGKMLNFRDNPFLYGIYADKNPYLVIMKSTQNGITEYLIVREFDESGREGRSVFHVLPTIDLIGRFVKNRANRSIGFSEYYKTMVKPTQKSSDAMSLKHFGKGTIAYVGSNSGSAFTEFPAQTVIVDELDMCDQQRLVMAWERLSFAEDKRQGKIGNPTIEDFGIHGEFLATDQKYWYIKCECGHWISPDFFLHVVRHIQDNDYVIRDPDWEPHTGRDIRLVCDKCGRFVDRRGKGLWVAKYPDREKSGFQLGKLFTSRVTVEEVVERFEKGLYNDWDMQRFYNADCGLPFTAPGSSLARTDLDACKGDDMMPYEAAEGTACIAGADVGTKIHIRISQILPDGRLRAMYIGSVDEIQDVLELSRRYNVVCGVIDAMPETRKSKELVASHPGWFMCYFNEVKRDIIDPLNRILTVLKTPAMDAVKEAYLSRKIVLPPNADKIPEFYDHMTVPVRTYDEQRQAYVWQRGNKDDHLYLAEAYQLLAHKFIAAITR